MTAETDFELEARQDYFKDTAFYTITSDSSQQSEVFVEQLLSYLCTPPSASILVIPCLEGTQCLYLSKKGMKVTGCAEHPESLKLCQQRSKEADLEIEWVNGDLDEFCQPDTYDLILSLDYAFGAFNDENKNRKIIANLYKSLAPQGKIAFQLIGRDALEKYFHPKYWIELEEECFLLNERTIDFDGWLEEKYCLIQEGRVKKYRFGQRVYYPMQFSELLEDFQFKNIRLWGDCQGSPYNDQSPFILAVAEKISNRFVIRC